MLIYASLGDRLGPLETFLGFSWGPLGRLLAALRASWGHLAPSWDDLGGRS